MVKAVVHVDAPRPHVFSILTDYPRYKDWVPGCERSAVTHETGSTAEAEVVINSAKRMMLGLRFEAHPQQMINFRMVRGTDVRAYSGSYRLMDSADGKGTVLIAELQVDVGGMVPQFMVDRMVSRSFDETGKALRAYVQKAVSASGVTPSVRRAITETKPRRARRLLRIVKAGESYQVSILGESFAVKPHK